METIETSVRLVGTGCSLALMSLAAFTSVVSKPMYETISISPSSTSISVNLPSLSATAVLLFFTTFTDAPGNGKPSSLVTVPLTVILSFRLLPGSVGVFSFFLMTMVFPTIS